MNILKFGAKHWCQWADVEIDLVSGVNGIIGQNGHGKSNLIEVIMFLFRGTTTKNGTAQDNIQHGYTQAEAWVLFVHKGAQYRLSRKVGRSSNSATLVGIDAPDYQYKGVTEVNAALEALFGLPRSFLDKHSFISQGELRALVKGTPSERMDLFISMLPLVGQAEKIRTQVIAEYGKVPINTLPYEDAVLVASLAVQTDKLLDTERKLVDAKALLAALDIKWAKEVLQSAERSKLLGQAYSAIMAAQNEYDLSLSDLAVAEEAATKRVAVVAAAQALVNPELSKYANYQWDTAQQTSDAYHRTCAEIEESIAKEALLDKGDATRQKRVEVAGLVATLKSEYDVINAALTKANRTAGMAECPTCGTRLDGDAAKVEIDRLQTQLRERYAALEAASTELRTIDADLALTNQSRTAAASHRQNLVFKKEHLLKWFTSNPYPTGVDRAAVELNAKYAQDAKLLAFSHSSNQEVQLNTTRVSQRLNALESEKKKAAKLESAEVVAYSEADVSTARSIVEKWPVANCSVNALTTELTYAQSRLQDINGQIAAQAAAVQKQERTMAYRSTLDTVVQLLHRDAYPRKVLEPYLNKFKAHTSKYLRVFNNPFSLEFDDNLGAAVTLPTGYPMKLAGLSGAQESIAAISQRLAIFDIFCKDYGLLILDEPSESMSSENAALLGEVITRANAAGGHARQIIVVTHHESMHSSFDKVIHVVVDGSSTTAQ